MEIKSFAQATQDNKQKMFVSFQGGITRAFENGIQRFGVNSEARLIAYAARSNGIIGHFPQEFITVLRNNHCHNFSKSIEILQNAFNEASFYFKVQEHVSKKLPPLDEEIHKLSLTVAKKILKKAAIKAKLIDKKGDILITYLGHGTFGAVHKIEFKNSVGSDVVQPKCIKTYFAKTKPGASHGLISELNLALFLRKICWTNFKTSNFANVHWGNIKKSYIISDFVDEKTIPKHIIQLKNLGLKHYDINGLFNSNKDNSFYNYYGKDSFYELDWKQQKNKIKNSQKNRHTHNATSNGVIYDYGGILPFINTKIINYPIGRKIFQTVYSQTTKESRISTFEKLLQNLKEGHFNPADRNIIDLALETSEMYLYY